MLQIQSDADLRTASQDDPLLVHLLPHRVAGTPAFGLDGAVVLAYDYWDDIGWQVIGPPAAAARLLGEAAPHLVGAVHISVPEKSVQLLPEALFEPDVTWRFRWSDRRPAAPEVEARWLDESEWPDVTDLLDDSFADASVRPHGRHARRWAGIRDDGGRLVACAADCTESEIGFMASVASRLSARRAGVGLAVTCWLTHRLLDDFGRAALWQYGDNIAATALYDRLGYADEHRMVAGKLL